MARKRSLDEGPVVRREILRQASGLFHQRGFGATSIRDIAEAAGISSSTMYHHFTNKQDVLHAVVSAFMTDFVDTLVPVLRDPSVTPAARMREAVQLHIEMSDDRRPELLVGNPIRNALEPAHRQDAIALQRAYHDAVRDVIELGVRQGEFHIGDLGLTTMAVLDMLNGVREWFTADGPLSRDEVVLRYQQMIDTLLTNSPRIQPS